jgi:hypothetical protein
MLRMSSGKKIGVWIASLCLLCCAVPLLAMFAGGVGLTAVAGLGFLGGGKSELLACMAGAVGLAVAAYAVWRIWRRRESAVACDVPATGPDISR